MTFVLSNPHWDARVFEMNHPNRGEYPSWEPPFRYVYIARERDGHRLKIGLTASLVQRLTTLRTEPLLVFQTPYWHAHGIEQLLHRTFAKERLDGEWFTPSARLVAFVAECIRGRPTLEAHHWRGVCRGEVVG